MRILIADRSSDNREAIIAAFKGVVTSVRVVEVDNGVDCLEKLMRNDFDLAFLDVDMPRLGGMEILSLASQKGFRTFIIIMSLDLKADMLSAVRQLKAYDFLPKPFSVAAARKVFDNYLTLTKRLSVLVVDDVPATRKIVSRVLEQCRFNLRMDEADGGKEAVEWSTTRHYDLAFLDWNMPEINGIDTLKKLRSTNEKIKAVLMTAAKPEELTDEVRQARFNAILHKPFFPQDIDDVLCRLYNLTSRHLGNAAEERAARKKSA